MAFALIDSRLQQHFVVVPGPDTCRISSAYDVEVAQSDSRITAESARELVRDLDLDQRRAVTSEAPLLAVIAGAGSGKTTVLTRRVVWRCTHGNADPMHTVVITFTRQAAGELRRRLRNLGIQETITAGTFHAISLSLLQQHWERVGRKSPMIVQDRRRLIGEVIGPKRTALIEDLASEIDWARSRNVTADQYERAAQQANRSTTASPDEVRRVLNDLEALKAKRGVIDVDDLLSLVIDTARRDKDFANVLHWRYRHLFVDEAQDMNPLQRAVLDVFRGDRDDLTLVGDPSQSIYGFNGSDPTILLELETQFPGIEVVRLDTNYRCTPQIVRAGLRTLSHLDAEVPPLRSARPDGSGVTVYGFDDDVAEARGVVALLERLHEPNESWRKFAVLARTNAQLTPIRAALDAAFIPVRNTPSNSDDPVQRCVRDVGELPSRSRLAAWARDVRLEDPTDGAAKHLGELDEADRKRSAELRVASAVDEFLADGGVDGRSFLAWVRTHKPFDDSPTTSGVDLLTFHAAKGREWDTVFLVGCEEGFMPHSSARDPMALAEETRLAYVAVTRAADRLLLTYARSRKGRRRIRSPYLDGISEIEPASPPSPEFLESLRARRADRHHSDEILEELVAWRRHAASVSGVEPSLICPDGVLSDIARTRPATVEELATLPGIGVPLASRAGRAIIRAIERGVSRQSVGDRDRESRTSPA